MCCCFKSIRLAINVVDASADFIMVTKRILLVPFFYFLLSIAVIFTWFPGYVMVTSINPISATSAALPQVRSVAWSNDTIAYAFIMWFGLIWSLIVVDYVKCFIVLFSSTTYYFNSPQVDEEGKSSDGSAEVLLGAKLAHTKHLGSICFGALIIAIIKVIRFLFVYLATKLVEASGGEGTVWGKVAKCFIACGACILRCIEKICDYINQSAYAY